MAETATIDTNASNAAGTGKAEAGKTALADAFREHFSGDAPIGDKVKAFAKAKPWASAALAGIAGLAILGSLKGRAR